METWVVTVVAGTVVTGAGVSMNYWGHMPQTVGEDGQSRSDFTDSWGALLELSVMAQSAAILAAKVVAWDKSPLSYSWTHISLLFI